MEDGWDLVERQEQLIFGPGEYQGCTVAFPTAARESMPVHSATEIPNHLT